MIRVCGLVHRPEFEIQEKTTFWKLDLFLPSGDWCRLAVSKVPKRVAPSSHLKKKVNPASETLFFSV
jgi:hypothetical protein